MTDQDNSARSFYDDGYRQEAYAPLQDQHEHSYHEQVTDFVETYDLNLGHCLEVGCGRGGLQNIIEDYVGIDVAVTAGAHLEKPFAASSAIQLPFADNSFDALWSIWVFEHVPNLEQALREVRRVVKPNGLLFLAPAWRCRPWYADGYPVRPYSDFGISGKLIKASIPLRDSKIAQALTLLPKRVARQFFYQASNRPTVLKVQSLDPNYETYWMPDSDALNGIDPHEFVLWFVSRGDDCLSHPSVKEQLFGKKEGVVLRVNK
ncbi:MAG: class I SAM-dependent methyltransferase [Anaerolineae bacterium]